MMRSKAIYCVCLVLTVILAFGTACAGDSGFVKLTRSSQTVDFFPVWSPDGSQIACFSGVLDSSDNVGGPWVWSDWGIFVMDADGSNRFRVATRLEAQGIAWSPSGNEIVFATSRGGIGITGLEGDDLRFLVPEEAEWDKPSGWPSYSPDGTRILFGRLVPSEPEIHPGYLYQVFVMDADGTNVTKLSSGYGSDHEPAWSPDGHRIAFSSYRDGQGHIYVMNADGSNVVRLTDDTGEDSCPAWSPDGSRIAFISTYDYKSEVYVMNSDGSNVVRLTKNSIREVSLCWSPDGSTLAICGTNSADYGSIYLLKMI